MQNKVPGKNNAASNDIFKLFSHFQSPCLFKRMQWIESNTHTHTQTHTHTDTHTHARA